MKVVLVNIGVFQEYIFYCIKQLQLHGNCDITIITNRHFFEKFSSIEPHNETLTHTDENLSGAQMAPTDENLSGAEGGRGIFGALRRKSPELIAVEDLDDMNYHLYSGMCRQFRGGFAFYASQRLFFVYSYMKKYNIRDCVHIENDNMIYENLDNVFPGSPPASKVCAVFDSPRKVIPGILYIPSINSFREILEKYRPQLNDMENLGMRQDAIEKLPIIPIIKDYTNPHYTVGLPYAQNFGRFGSRHIFDGAAIGQYLGGIDPRNTTEKDTRGFVNETCVVKFNHFEFIWTEGEDGLYRPHLKIDGADFPIVNLHIHSKNLADFLGAEKLI